MTFLDYIIQLVLLLLYASEMTVNRVLIQNKSFLLSMKDALTRNMSLL